MVQHIDNPVVELHNVTVAYQQKPVLWNIDYTLPEGNLIGIIGPNGSGKTTMIKAMMGLLPLSSGYTKIFGKDLDDVRSRVSYVPQRGSVDWDFPANVLDVVLMGRSKPKNIFKRLTSQDRAIALECLRKVKMENFVKRQISQLSGGQQQRVFLARALAQEADLYLMDEPFVGVDMATEQAIIDLLKEMREKGKTILVVHHDLQTVKDYFDWVVLLNTRLVASGKTEDVFQSELLNETYGGKLNILSQVSNLLKAKGHPVREK
ncbi:MAG: metal ABC transporter ATP-binding protein [Microscillaceae bacterium]|jgi:manganese/zinc/iron transport system ATP- binding protein|nr:metal ABC transporter ATP-binding protein [Microscillaceae bacterium]